MIIRIPNEIWDMPISAASVLGGLFLLLLIARDFDKRRNATGK
jgi:hypothetical protein